MDCYRELADVYDRLMRHIDLAKHVDFCLDAVRRNGWQGRNILEPACGTGSIMLEMLKKGYQVTGIDISADMLTNADNKIFQAGYTPRLLNQDIRKLALPQDYDLAVCAFDSLNYILKEKDLLKVFTGVNKALLPQGFFVFDINSEYKMSELQGQNIYIYDEKDIYYTWQNNYDVKKQRCRMELDVFTMTTGGLYRHFRERHVQQYHSPELVAKLLKESGFRQLAVYGDSKFRKPGPRTERLFVVAQKAV